MFITAGLVNNTVERPEHLSDLLSLPLISKSTSTRPKSSRQNQEQSKKGKRIPQNRPGLDKEHRPEYKPK